MKFLFIIIILLYVFNYSSYSQIDKIDSIYLVSTKNVLKNDSFTLAYNIKSIPNNIIKCFTKIDRLKFRITDTDQDYNKTDISIKKNEVHKKLIYLAFNDSMYIVVYEQGGFGIRYFARIVKMANNKIECVLSYRLQKNTSFDELIVHFNSSNIFDIDRNKSKCF